MIWLTVVDEVARPKLVYCRLPKIMRETSMSGHQAQNQHEWETWKKIWNYDSIAKVKDFLW